ncbi:MAG: hypothetical protein QOD33_1523 [Pyrinomonadaceae bacterium]|jgi:Zn-finger nucleic acid-binding protein|nr:hypothetical protein [Pyrinomonadaceae bacterium]
MKIPSTIIPAVALALLTALNVYGQNDRDHARSAVAVASVPASQIHLKLKDGSSIAVDEAWESEQGIWYRRGGMSHLVLRDQVKQVDRGAAVKSQAPSRLAKVLVNADENAGEDADVANAVAETEQPVWIYLKGGARVEADSVSESAAGAWYQRGSLTVFVERDRIDHIERESSLVAGSSGKGARGWTTGRPNLDGLIRQSGTKYGVDPYLIFCVMEQESHFNARALSPKGARGLMQLMPGTGARFGVTRPGDPAQNIAGGTRYLKQLLGQFNGRIDLVLASYNAGEGAVLKFGRKVPPYRETREYVRRISYRYHGPRQTIRPRNDIAGAAAAL